MDKRKAMVKIAFRQKENANEIHSDILDKMKFFEKYKSIGHVGILSNETLQNIEYLESRAYELD